MLSYTFFFALLFACEKKRFFLWQTNSEFCLIIWIFLANSLRFPSLDSGKMKTTFFSKFPEWLELRISANEKRYRKDQIYNLDLVGKPKEKKIKTIDLTITIIIYDTTLDGIQPMLQWMNWPLNKPIHHPLWSYVCKFESIKHYFVLCQNGSLLCDTWFGGFVFVLFLFLTHRESYPASFLIFIIILIGLLTKYVH